MKDVSVIRWKCDWCNKTLAKKSAMLKHEKSCWRNPDSRACQTCKNFVEGFCEKDIAPAGTVYSTEDPWEPLREVTQKIRDCDGWETVKGGEE